MQVHDSLVLDIKDYLLETIAPLAIETMNKLPEYIIEYWNIEWNVPLTGELKYGPNWCDTVKWKG